MRIVAGQWRGRRVTAPAGSETRPTADRVREAVFSSVTTRLGGLDGLHVVDLYAGSGALGLEALSRGAAHVTFVEADRRAAATIRANLAALGGASRATVHVSRVERIDRWHLGGPPVSLLFADPPYRIDAATLSQVLETLADGGALEVGALAVYEHAAGVEAVWPTRFDEAGVRRYGDTEVSYGSYRGGERVT
jgi:16S rRNA (guanine966-N2)-methyltransferase